MRKSPTDPAGETGLKDVRIQLKFEFGARLPLRRRGKKKKKKKKTEDEGGLGPASHHQPFPVFAGGGAVVPGINLRGGQPSLLRERDPKEADNFPFLHLMLVSRSDP